MELNGEVSNIEQKFFSMFETSPFSSIWLEISINWDNKRKGPKSRMYLFSRGRIYWFARTSCNQGMMKIIFDQYSCRFMAKKLHFMKLIVNIQCIKVICVARRVIIIQKYVIHANFLYIANISLILEFKLVPPSSRMESLYCSYLGITFSTWIW